MPCQIIITLSEDVSLFEPSVRLLEHLGERVGTIDLLASAAYPHPGSEARQWDGSRESIEALCRWANSHPVPPDLLGDASEADEPTLSYLTTNGEDVADVRLWTAEGDVGVRPGEWISYDGRSHSIASVLDARSGEEI